jgi:hypothetical protein
MKRRSACIAVVASTLAFAGVAYAVPTDLDDVVLTASGTTEFQYGNTYGSHFMIDDAESSPTHSDAFDGGLELFVGGAPYTTLGGIGELTGTNRLSGAAKKMGKLKVSRVDETLSMLPAVRVLVKLQNPTKKAVKTDLTMATNLGSDTETAVRASSSGDQNFDRKDRWGITSDDATTPGDAVVTFVHFGAGKVLKPSSQRGPESTPDDGVTSNGDERVEPTFKVKVPGKKTVYLMFFAELHDTNGAAIMDAGEFDARRLDADLLIDIGASVRKKIVNWDLG